jgi:dihydroorotate dehydrogenase (fumarate)
MNLTTNYMGLQLRSPLVPSAAAPLTEDINNVKRMEDAGAGAVILHSLFEEQIRQDKSELHYYLTQGTESYPEAITYFPAANIFHVGPQEYLNHIRQAKEMVDIPIIASLNGLTLGGWLDYAKQIEQAGADALELNIYYLPTDIELAGSEVEQNYINIVSTVRSAVSIPIAVKLSPYFSNMANMAKLLAEAGANGLVLFNRFYQPDINLTTLEVEPNVVLSTSQAMRLPLHWIAILYSRINNVSFAATSGIYTAIDVLKMLMVGADVTMLCSVLLQYSIEHMRVIETAMRQWMERNEYESIQQMRGSMSQKNCPNPTAFERVQYMRSLQTYIPESQRISEPTHFFG